jgi:hypothetical protein
MNILPLVFTLIIILSVLTIEKMERFTHKVIIQKKYEQLFSDQHNSSFNIRQRRLCGLNPRSHRRISFRAFLQKKFRDENPEKYKQIRQITIDLIQVLYGHTKFYKKMDQKRPDFVSELLDAIEASTVQMHENSIKTIQDASKIKLEDPVLQEVYYRMLKGTIGKEESKKELNKELMNSEKAYMPLLTFFNYEDVNSKIKLGLASREILLAIYGNSDLVQKLIDMRIELTNNLNNDRIQKDEATAKFQAAFENKQKQGITDILDYTITTTSKIGYD